jgi:hypothetical protein
MIPDADENIDLRGLAAVINSRLATDARLTKAIAFGWLCGGAAIGIFLTGLGVALALYGYSYMLSIKPAAEQTAKALITALEQSVLKATVSGIMSLSPDSELRLAGGQTIKLDENTTIKLDPSSSVRVAGDLKMPQPSKHQLQTDAATGNDELAFTSYTIFRDVPLGQGAVETGWYYDLSDTLRPRHQICNYRQALDEGLAGKITIAMDGSPKRLSPLVKLPFKFEEALANCIWFSGY